MSLALAVDAIKISVTRSGRPVFAVTDVSFAVDAGEALGIVGESGSGKTLTLRGLMNILPPRVERREVRLRFAPETPHRAAMVFQEPLTAMSPTKRVQDLIAEGVLASRGGSRRAARERALQLMAEVGIPHPTSRARMWPHELSGGLRQRVVIAMALAGDPTVLLCDEPTTALDVTVQDQILGLLDRLRRERGLAVVFVTHDLAVVATLCQRIAVMYAGQIVEIGPASAVLRAPRHPYTAALVRASRSRSGLDTALPIAGGPPTPGAFPPGCRFAPRCSFAEPRCTEATYVLAPDDAGRATACIRADEIDQDAWA